MRYQKGFTLVEVLIAMMILTGAMIVITSSWSGSILAVNKSRNLNTISYLLKKKMSEVELKYRDTSAESIPDGPEDGEFEGDDYKDYKWTVESRKMEFPDMTDALVARDGGANEMLLSMVKQMTELFNKSIKEVRVTVTWTVGKRSLPYSLTTYIVDYQKLMALGGMAGAGGGSSTGTGGSNSTNGGTPPK